MARHGLGHIVVRERAVSVTCVINASEIKPIRPNVTVR